MEYEKMLDRLYLSLPKKALEKSRFEIPDVDAFIQGNRTILKNFSQLAKTVNREEKHLFKFMTKELATAASIEEGRLLLNGKFFPPQLQKIFDAYVKAYVLCPECGKPDTKFVDYQGVKMLKCEACGAMHPVKKI
jgi:translation initiation factor 2 subunit 2